MRVTLNEDAAKAIQALTNSIRTLTKVPVVLVVDDSAQDRELIINAVRQFFTQCEILECDSGVIAVEILGKRDVDIVFLDVRLPRIGGVEVLRRVRAINPPVIVMVTGFGEETEETIEAIKLGAVRVIAKPVTQADLKATLGAI